MVAPIHINGYIGKHVVTSNCNTKIKVLIQNESGKYLLFEDKEGNLDHFYLYLKHDMSITNTICNYLRVYINYFKIRPNDFEMLKYYKDDSGKNIFIYKLNHILPSKNASDFYIPTQSNFIKIKIVPLKELKELNLFTPENEIKEDQESTTKRSYKRKSTNTEDSSE